MTVIVGEFRELVTRIGSWIKDVIAVGIFFGIEQAIIVVVIVTSIATFTGSKDITSSAITIVITLVIADERT